MGPKSTVRSTVEVDDRGRITIPKSLRERWAIRPGDELQIRLGKHGLWLEPDRTDLVTASSGKSDWGPEAFPDAGDATFGGRPRTEE